MRVFSPFAGYCIFFVALIFAAIQLYTGDPSAALISYGLFLFLFWKRTFSVVMAFVSSVFIFGFLAFFALQAQLPFFGSWSVVCFGVLILAVYFGLNASFLVAFASFVVQLFDNILWFCLVFESALLAWVFWLTRLSFWPLGVVEGSYLLHPLVPLVDFGLVRLLLSLFGDLGSVFLITLFLFFLFELFARRRWFAFSSLVLLFFIVTILSECFFEKVPAWVSCIGGVAPSFCPFPEKNSYELLEDLAAFIDEEVAEDKVCVVLPETVFPYGLHLEGPLAGRLGQLSSDNRMVLLGSYHFCSNGTISNAAVGCWRGEIANVYDKSHRVPFAERFPSWAAYLLSFLGYNVRNFALGNGAVSRISTPLPLKCVPLMCSELFFTKRLLELPLCSNDFVCALINDGWFGFSPLVRILFQTARFQAVWAHKPLIYVSYTRQCYITSRGNWIGL